MKAQAHVLVYAYGGQYATSSPTRLPIGEGDGQPLEDGVEAQAQGQHVGVGRRALAQHLYHRADGDECFIRIQIQI